MNALSGIGGDILGAFQAGQQARRQADYGNALAAYAVNPTDQALVPLAQYDPGFVMSERRNQQQAMAAKEKQQQSQLPIMDKLLGQVTDEASYGRALGMAQRYGLDTSQIPQTYDPKWVQETHDLVKAIQTPQGQEALSTAGKQAADMGYKPGTPEFASAVHDIYIASESKPYVVGGETRLYTPKIGGSGEAVGQPPPGAIEALKRGEGTPEQFDEMFGAGAAAKFTGGQTATPSATFSGEFRGLPGERVTSGYRTPAHNREVGGVSNSFHTRKDAQGRPLGRDSVPPPGMSLSAYHSRLKALNPDKDVILESDHVHMEPRG